MKYMKYPIFFALTLVFLVSCLTVGASAAYSAERTGECGNGVSWNCGTSDPRSSFYPYGSCANSILGDPDSSCLSGQSICGGRVVSGGTSLNQALEAYLNAAGQNAATPETQSGVAEEPTSACGSAEAAPAYNGTNSSCTASDRSAASAPEKTVPGQTAAAAGKETAAAQASAVKETAPQASAEEVPAYAAANPETAADCNSSGGASVSDSGCSQSSHNTWMRYISDFLKKCGIDLNALGIDLPDRETTAETSQPSSGTSEATSGESETTSAGSSGDSQTAAGQNGTDTAQNADSLTFEEQVAALVNEQRAANGLKPLTLSAELSNAARAKSQDMHDNHYFAHESPTYGSPFDMLTAFGIRYQAAGENIAMGYATPEAVMNAWMNSSGHRANILSTSYTQIGVGYVADGNYWTQEFTG